MWINSGQVRMATTSEPREFLSNGVVTSATTLPIVSHNALSCSVFRVGAGLFIHMADAVAGDGRNVIYKANSASNPTSWSLYSTIDSHSGGDDYFDGADLWVPSVPRVDGSRWLMFIVYQSRQSNSHYRRATIVRSTDNGQTWSIRIPVIYNVGGLGQSVGAQVPHIGKDPATGYFYHGGESGAGGGTFHWMRSTDDGINWSEVDNAVTAMPVWDDGSYMHGLSGTTPSGNVKIVRFDTPDDAQATTTVATAAPYTDHGHNDKNRARLVTPIPGLGLLLFHWDRVLTIGGGWQTGSVGFS